MEGAAGAAVVTSPSDAAVTVVASAFIGSDGTIIAQDGSWVSSVFVASAGLYELTLNSATFATARIVSPTSKPSRFPLSPTR